MGSVDDLFLGSHVYLDTAAPALFTAIHLAMAILRRHRASGRAITSPFVITSFLFPLVPWVFPTALGLAIGFGVHAAWLFACEVLAPPLARSRSVRSASAPPPPAPAAPAPARAASGPSFLPAAVLAVLDETADIKTFRFARPEGFEFKPGQFVTVRVQIDGKPHVRCYSISSAPHTRGYVEISVRRQGLVSGALHATVRAGSVLSLRRPAGHFVYPAGDDRPLALIAGGIGITPLLSMLRHAAASDPTRPVTLLYSARTEGDVAFYHVLRVLAERHPLIRVAITLTRSAGAARLRIGRLDEQMVRQYVAAPADTIFCLCGPGQMISDTRQILASMGVPDSQVRYEKFDTAVAASQVNTAVESPAPVAAGPASHRVTFETSGITVGVPPMKTLLDAAEDAGVRLTSSCRAGVCQSCRTRLKSGHADCRSDVLDPEDRAAGFILPCVTWPTDDCVLEA